MKINMIAVVSPTSAVRRANDLDLSVNLPLGRKEFALHFCYFQMCRQFQPQVMQQYSLMLGRSGNAASPDFCPFLCGHYDIDRLNLSNLVKNLARLVAQSCLGT